MKLANYTAETLTKELMKRVNEIDCRERIVVKFPFTANINRIEIYCGETAPDNNISGTALFGNKLSGITSIQVFTDNSNKATNKSSYSYKKELINYIPSLVQKMYATIK